MPEYIEREALLREVMMSRPWVLNGTDNEKELTEQECFDWFENLVQNAPTADVQKVVRCKDCFFCEELEYHPNGVMMVCELLKRVTQEDNFCTYGVKRIRSI